jgi:hypothetical protein
LFPVNERDFSSEFKADHLLLYITPPVLYFIERCVVAEM